MKRVTYISSGNNIQPEDLDKILEEANKNNTIDGLTGILIFIDNIFFQILEGEFEKVNICINKILTDPRHRRIIIINNEENIEKRHYPEWAMKLIKINKTEEYLISPIKSLLHCLRHTNLLLSKFSQSNIMKILEEGIDPFKTHPRKTEIIILFFDIVGFTHLAKNLDGERLSKLLNKFLTIISNEVELKNGVVNKFLGDGLLAYFDAESADNAISASISILNKFKNTRSLYQEKTPEKYIYIGIGIAKGHVLEGIFNFGNKSDYTIIGKSVNIAQRLESYTRKSPYCLLLTQEVKEAALHNWSFIQVENKTKKIQKNIYSLQCDLTNKIDKDKIIEGFHSCNSKK